MPFPAGPWARLIIFSRNDEKEWRNVIWFHPAATIPPTFDVQQCVNDFMTHLGAAFANPLQFTDAEVVGGRLYVNNGTYTVSADSTASYSGNEASAELPTEMAVVVQIRTNDPGPSGRGRIFISGVCEANTTVSDLSTAGSTLYHAIVVALTGAISAGSVTWKTALYSKKLGTVKEATFIRLDRELAHKKKRRPIF